MSTLTIKLIKCDGRDCQAIAVYSHRFELFHDIRMRLKKEKWKWDKINNRDYCPKCKKMNK